LVKKQFPRRGNSLAFAQRFAEHCLDTGEKIKMDLERSLPTSTCDIVSAAGQLIATTKAAVLPERIIVFDTSIPIGVGDEVRRKLPSGQDEAFEVTDPTFFEKLHGTKAHYQLKYRRKGVFPHGAGGNYTVHVTGSNSRVNIASTDRSTNVVVEGDVFGNLTAVLRQEVREGAELDRLLAAVEEMRTKQKSPGFAAAYQKFVSIAADQIAIIAPFLPALANLISG
jgi:hypothetical protein